MKKGDLVKFTSALGFQAAYAPSGIIVGIEKRDIMGFAERVSYKVLWLTASIQENGIVIWRN